jgi:hypothetical protein
MAKRKRTTNAKDQQSSDTVASETSDGHEASKEKPDAGSDDEFMRFIETLEASFVSGPWSDARNERLASDIAAVQRSPSVWYELLGGTLGALEYQAGLVYFARRDERARQLKHVFSALHAVLRSGDWSPLDEFDKLASATLHSGGGPAPPFPAHKGEKRDFKTYLKIVAREALIRHNAFRNGQLDVGEETRLFRAEVERFGGPPYVSAQAATEYQKWLAESKTLTLRAALAVEMVLRGYLTPFGAFSADSAKVVSADGGAPWCTRVEAELARVGVVSPFAEDVGETANQVVRGFARAFGQDGKNFLSIFEKDFMKSAT